MVGLRDNFLQRVAEWDRNGGTESAIARITGGYLDMFDQNGALPDRDTAADYRRCAVLAAGIDTDPILDALQQVPNTRIGDICIFPANGRGEPEADFLILAAEDGSRLARLAPQIERWSGRKTRLLLAVPEAKCAFLGPLAERADGIIMLHGGLKYLEESLCLASEGYSVMPAPKEPGSDSYGHLDTLSKLSESEQAILPLLAMGASNRCISEELGESETRVKSLVRTILVKLDCRNRTEAAVLAATVLLPLRETLRRQAAQEADGPGKSANGEKTANGTVADRPVNGSAMAGHVNGKAAWT